MRGARAAGAAPRQRDASGIPDGGARLARTVSSSSSVRLPRSTPPLPSPSAPPCSTPPATVGRSGLRRRAHARGLRRRPARRAAAPARRRHLRGDRGGRRRHRLDRRGDADGERGRARRAERVRGSTRCWPAARRPARSRAATVSTCESELRMLRAIARFGGVTRSTSWRPSWARTRCRRSIATGASATSIWSSTEMIPAVAEDGLAEWCDVFCETGVFTPTESQRILEAGLRARTESRGSTPTSSAPAAARRSPRASARDRPIT